MISRNRLIAAIGTAILGATLLAAPTAAQAAPATDGGGCAVGVSLPAKLTDDSTNFEYTIQINNPNNCDLSALQVGLRGSNGATYVTAATGDPTATARQVDYSNVGTANRPLGDVKVEALYGNYNLAGTSIADIKYSARNQTFLLSTTNKKVVFGATVTWFNGRGYTNPNTRLRLQTIKKDGKWHTIATRTTNRGHAYISGSNPKGKQQFRVVADGNDITRLSFGKVRNG